jgi:tetratricopeptide (TPR) repeat protein
VTGTGGELADAARRALAATRAGTGRLLLVTGAAGAGKTRLAHAIRLAAEQEGLATAWAVSGRAGSPPFWPWRRLLETLPTAIVDAHPDAAGRLAAPRPGPADLRARFELFEQVAGLFADAARSTPMVVVIDDLHEADAASLLLLQHIGPLLRSIPLLVVATVRTDTVPDRPEWPAVWTDLLRHGEVLTVGPLGEDDIAGLLDAAIGAADPGLVRRIARRTGGNALFVCELIRLCAASGGDVDALPDTVRALIAARVAERSASCRRVLSLAATIGPAAPLDVVVDVLGNGLDEVLAGVDEAARHGLLDAADPNQIGFVHEIVRDAVYDGLPAAHRLHWHRAVAERLAAAGSAADAAHHFRLAGPDAREAAARWYVRAGEQSLGMLAYEDAAAQLRAALECGIDRPGRVQLGLGSALLAVGDTAGARVAHLAAVESGRRAGDPDLLAAGALGLGAGPAGFEVPLFDREQIAALQDALGLLGDGVSATRALVLARLATALSYTAEDRRADLAAEAVRVARACGDEAALAVALASRADVIAGPDHAAERLALTTEVVEIAERLRDSSLELLGRRQRIVARLELGDMTGTSAEIRNYRTVAGALRQPLYSWYVPLWDAALALARGRLDEARDRLDEARLVGAQAGSANAETLVLTFEFFRAAELADRTAMRALFERSPLDESMGPWVPITLALVHACLGEVSAARASLDAAADRLATLPRDSEWLPSLTQAAEAALLVGGHPLAGWLYEALAPYADLFVVEGIAAVPRGSVARHLGILAALLGDRTGAEAHFAHALEANRRIGARLFVARTLHDAATALGDRDRLAAARELYAEIGAPERLVAPGLGAPAPSGNVLRRDGDVWTLEFAGQRATLRASKGLRDLAVLLAAPGRAVPALDLATARPANDTPADTGDLHEPGDLGELVDARARRAYRDRLRELETEAADADAAGDPQRSARVAAERDALVAELGAAYGLAGRPRRAGSTVERARTTVTARIRDSIKRIEAAHPALGRHLSAAVRTGTLCSYEPEHPVTWQVTP